VTLFSSGMALPLGCAHGEATNVTTYGYNPDGQIAQITDPLGETFEYTYDADDRLSSILMTDTEQNETTKTIL
jgi:YD repeat-containing protein